jgi:hypothetical protein
MERITLDPPAASVPYDALSLGATASLYMGVGVIGIVLYMFILLSYLYIPIIKAQHPAADIVIWQVFTGIMTGAGFILSYANTVR